MLNENLSTVVEMAISIVNTASRTGEIDFSNTESMFKIMKEVEQNEHRSLLPTGVYNGVDTELTGVYKACLCVGDVDSVDCLGGIEGLPARWEDLPAFIVNRAPAYKQLDQLLRGVALIKDACLNLSKDEVISFKTELADLMEEYDLLGFDTVVEIFDKN